jgi:hypothetical protein
VTVVVGCAHPAKRDRHQQPRAQPLSYSHSFPPFC